MSPNRFRAQFDKKIAASRYDMLADEQHYHLFVNDHPYTIGYLKRDQHGKWFTYCGGRRSIDFSDLSNMDRFDSADEALKAFRDRYEAAEKRATELAAAALAKIAGRPLPHVVKDSYLTDEQFTSIRMVVSYIYDRKEGVEGAIGRVEFECSPQEFVALLECPDTNVTCEGFTSPANAKGKRQESFTQWSLPCGGPILFIRNVGTCVLEPTSPMIRRPQVAA